MTPKHTSSFWHDPNLDHNDRQLYFFQFFKLVIATLIILSSLESLDYNCITDKTPTTDEDHRNNDGDGEDVQFSKDDIPTDEK